MKQNPNIIGNFLSFCSATGLTQGTVRKYWFDLKTLRRHLGKSIAYIKESDCDKFFAKIENNGYSEATKNHYKQTIGKFMRWRHDEVPKYLKPYLKIKHHNIIRPLTFMLNEEELQGILDCCKDLQEKTFFGVIMETGCRADELLQTKIEEVSFDDIGALIVREGKGKILRRIRIIKSCKLLREYMKSVHKNPKAKLFDYNYWNVRGFLRRLERKSKIGKHLNLHLFRKIVATKYAKHMTEYQLCKVMGWVAGSRMARHYVFLSGRDVDDALVKLNKGSWK